MTEATCQNATIASLIAGSNADQATIREQARTIARLERQLASFQCPIKGPMHARISAKKLSNPADQFKLEVYSKVMGLPTIDWSAA